MVRIDRKGTVVVINDDPKNHTHVYYNSIKEAMQARLNEFAELITEPFTLLLEYEPAHDRWLVMSNNKSCTYGKSYRPLKKKRVSVFIRDAKNVTALFDELGIDYVE